jgi:hypothetical protein
MKLQPIERTPIPRPSGADAASIVGSRVITVAPSKPADKPSSSIEPTPSVINMVGQSNKTIPGEGVYSSVSDPANRGSEAATAPKDWTIHRPVAEKVEDPPPPPLSKMLIDHIKALWTASASAIQVEQVKNQQDAAQPAPNAVSAMLTADALTYSPGKVQKIEKM